MKLSPASSSTMEPVSESCATSALRTRLLDIVAAAFQTNAKALEASQDELRYAIEKCVAAYACKCMHHIGECDRGQAFGDAAAASHGHTDLMVVFSQSGTQQRRAPCKDPDTGVDCVSSIQVEVADDAQPVGQDTRPDVCGELGNPACNSPSSMRSADSVPFLCTTDRPGINRESTMAEANGVEIEGKTIEHPTGKELRHMMSIVEAADNPASDGKGKGDESNVVFEMLPAWKKFNTGLTGCRGRDRVKNTAIATVMASMAAADVDDEEDEEQSSTSCWRYFIVHPYNQKRNLWDVSSLFLVLYDMIMIPMAIFGMPPDNFVIGMSWTTRLFWTCDMPLSFLSGFVTNNGQIELRPWPVARKYVRSWFALDCVVVGVDWLEFAAAAAAEGLGFTRMTKASRIFRVLRVVRLLRLARMKEVLALLMERLNNDRIVIVIDVLKLVSLMATAGHFLACMWYGLGSSHDTPEESWIVQYEYHEKSLQLNYVMSLRWAISQFAGGMDEVTPQSLPENVFAIIVYVLAFWSGAVFLSILTSSMTQLYLMGSKNAQDLMTLRRYMTQNGISKNLALRVFRNAQNALAEAQRSMPEDSVMLVGLVSEPLRMEMHSEMYSPVLRVHPFFARYIEAAPPVMARVCHTCMLPIFVSEGDTIFHAGETPLHPRMLILQNGKLSYEITEIEECVEEGTWVAEASLWTRWVHRGTLRAIVDSRLYRLDAQEFQRVVCQFEHTGFDPRAYAESFVEFMNSIKESISDLPHEDAPWMREFATSKAITIRQSGSGGSRRGSIRE